MLKYLFILTSFSLLAQSPSIEFPDNHKIAVQNSILTKVNGTTISVMDVKKKLDLMFYQNYSHLSHSDQARFQFYESGWRSALMQMIDNELILSDAAAKEVKLSDGEVREEIESRFGPHVFATLDKINITYDEAWKMVKNDLIVQRMNWWFIQSRAIQSVTPQNIRKAYQGYLKENPSYQELKYQVISMRGSDPQSTAQKIYDLVNARKESPDLLIEELKAIDPAIQVSTEYTLKDTELSEAHKGALSSLSPKSYSAPIYQVGRTDQKSSARIFYLNEKTNHEAPAFTDLSQKLKNDLIQQSIAETSLSYLSKLRKQYGFDPEHIKETLPEGMHLFSLQ